MSFLYTWGQLMTHIPVGPLFLELESARGPSIPKVHLPTQLCQPSIPTNNGCYPEEKGR